jgi:hypothetical protein
MEYLPKIINSIGLACDIVGALLIWRYGLPEPINSSGSFAVVEEPTTELDYHKLFYTIALCLYH